MDNDVRGDNFKVLGIADDTSAVQLNKLPYISSMQHSKVLGQYLVCNTCQDDSLHIYAPTTIFVHSVKLFTTYCILPNITAYLLQIVDDILSHFLTILTICSIGL